MEISFKDPSSRLKTPEETPLGGSVWVPSMGSINDERSTGPKPKNARKALGRGKSKALDGI